MRRATKQNQAITKAMTTNWGWHELKTEWSCLCNSLISEQLSGAHRKSCWYGSISRLTFTAMLTWHTILAHRGTHTTDMCLVLGKRRRRTAKSLRLSKRNSNNWLTREKTQPMGHTIAKHDVQRKCRSSSMYSSKGSCSFLSPSMSADWSRSRCFAARASAAAARVLSAGVPEPKPQSGLRPCSSSWVCSLARPGGQLWRKRQPPTAPLSAWKMSSAARRRKLKGASAKLLRRQPQQQRPGSFSSARVPPLASVMALRRHTSRSIGSSVLIRMEIRPETSMGPFMQDSKSLSRTWKGMLPFRQPRDHSPMMK
mmetsp:Transcript_1153/g.3545  ORF Transcript_1153/g.3545 Transcript_1153/m.3545 type:complete len:312 (+) Transcript_1153:213-1148(+)